jgi:hypothetical protein
MAGSHIDCLDQHMRRRRGSITECAGIHIVFHLKPLTITLPLASARVGAEHVVFTGVADSCEPMWTRRVIRRV